MKERLKKLLENSYSPVYKYNVAAIIITNDNQTFEGVNIETSSPAAGICAERNALYSLISAGYTKDDIKEIYIMNKTNKPCYPCFICRQALNDFCKPETKIVTYGYDGTENTILLKELCPYPFDNSDLNN
ncbi:MAG: cytidine deaminase [Bacilli bacterium]|nr:cytidine deaminase [Bacilli bacterium]